MLTYIAALIIGAVLYYLVSYPRDYWKKRNVPGPTPMPIFGNIKDFILGNKHIALVYDDIYRRYKDYPFIGIMELRQPNMLINDPKIINDIMVKNFDHFYDRGTEVDDEVDPLSANLVHLTGAKWKATRAKLMPAFSSAKLKNMYPLIEDCVQLLENHLDYFAHNGIEVDVREAMSKFSTDVIGRCAFGLDFNTLKDPNSEFRRIGNKIFNFTYQLLLRIIVRFINPKILKYIKLKAMSEDVENFFFKLVSESLMIRKAEAMQRNDFLQVMINIREREKLEDLCNDHEFSEKLLAANMFLFFAAGFETTASTLSYCLYELALNPDVQEKASKEIKEKLGSSNGQFSYDFINSLTYLEKVVSETLRLYVPIPMHGRICTKDYRLPESNEIIKKGSRITIPIYSIHRDSKYFPDPEKFDPERFNDDVKSSRPVGCYLPFGDGPRICIGLRFARLEVKRCLATMLLKYKFTINRNTVIPLKFKSRALFLIPQSSVSLTISKNE